MPDGTQDQEIQYIGAGVSDGIRYCISWILNYLFDSLYLFLLKSKSLIPVSQTKARSFLSRVNDKIYRKWEEILSYLRKIL